MSNVTVAISKLNVPSIQYKLVTKMAKCYIYQTNVTKLHMLAYDIPFSGYNRVMLVKLMHTGWRSISDIIQRTIFNTVPKKRNRQMQTCGENATYEILLDI